MIFVTLGSQKFQFNRLLKKIDDLKEKGIITEQVFAQKGASDYNPINFEYVDFMTQDEFNIYMNKCNVIITHAGTGVIVNAVKKGKKVIAIPRLVKYGEHIDNHQIQIIKQFEKLNLIEPVYELENLEKAIKIIGNKFFNKYKSNTQEILDDIKEYIERTN